MEQDADKNGKVNRIIRFGEGRKIAVMEMDTNGDGLMDRFDVVTRFRKGVPFFQEKDTNSDGKADVFTEFDKAGAIQKVEEDDDLTNVFDNEYISVVNVSGDNRDGTASYYAGPPFTAVLSASLEF